MAYLVEILDTSYKTPEVVEKDFELPVLISIPIRYTERELKSIKRIKVLAFVSVGIGFIISAVGIVFTLKGIDKTLSFVNKILEGM